VCTCIKMFFESAIVISRPLDYAREFNRYVDRSMFTFYFYPGDGHVHLRSECANGVVYVNHMVLYYSLAISLCIMQICHVCANCQIYLFSQSSVMISDKLLIGTYSV